MRGLDGKNVIVTGGGGAIGGAICRRFAGYGARVGVFDKNLVGAQKVAAEINGFASGVDIADYAAVGAAIASLAVKVTVTVSPTFARVGDGLFDARETTVSAGAVWS